MNKNTYLATHSPFRNFTRKEWSRLEEHPKYPISDINLSQLRGLNELLDKRVSYSAIGRILGVHRLTVSSFVKERMN
ncbi:MAG: hypothetical protein PHP31_01770 [Lentimicrobiaceae bacterium]|nr:hypothetical protein [Lentimicrobiaceae bacterium]